MLHGARTNADKTIQLQTIRINQRIRAKEVRVVLASTSEQLGVMKIQDALRKAQELGLDLVEVSANAVPPVCRIVDFGKFKYELSKHEKEKKQNAASKMKEIKFRVNIGTHDYETKLRHAEEFLDKGNKVRMLLQFRGREMAHQEFGIRLIERVKNDLEPFSVVEQYPKMEGRQMVMVLSPKKAVIKAPAPAPAAPKKTAAKPAEAAVAAPVAAETEKK